MGKTSSKKQRNERQIGPSTYTTVGGAKVLFHPISLLELAEIDEAAIAEYRLQGEPVDPPTYEMILAGGSKVEQPHDETTLEYPIELARKEVDDEEAAATLAAQRTRENRAAWFAHQGAIARLTAEINARRTDYMIEEGVEPVEPVDVEAWIEKRKRYGLRIPEDPSEQRTFCILRTVLVTEEDQLNAAMEILRISSAGVRREKVAAALSTFRDQVEGRETTGGAATGEGAGILDEQPEGTGSADGVEMEDTAKSVGRDRAIPDGESEGGDDGDNPERGG